jgi:DNA topoisomerase-1
MPATKRPASKRAAAKKAATAKATARRAAAAEPSSPGGGTKLVIVESATKAKTIRSFLPPGFKVKASVGHVRDLPGSADEVPAKFKKKAWGRLGVNVEDGFQPIYVVPPDKRKVVAELKEALADADELYLATDEDREGESIAWHLLELLEPRVPVKRMVFHEITKSAIQKALAKPRDVNDDLVRAQEARRVLDRLVGYSLSPLLWTKIARGLSAGRVQSAAVRLVVQRERQRRAFRAATYWDLAADLVQRDQPFEAQLVAVGGKRVAGSKDFDEATGQLKADRGVALLTEATATALARRLATVPWAVTAVEEEPRIRRPAPPFKTSTLQQEASRKLRMSAREAMRVAQALYERGFITYMRTDSVALSSQAIDAARAHVTAAYGAQFLPPTPRIYANRDENAQEAHEAIRPAGDRFQLPADTGLTGRELALYELIWKRTVASQMKDAELLQVTATIAAGDATFRATGQTITFQGFLLAHVEGSDDPDAALEERERRLPALAAGDTPRCDAVRPLGHETQPPARYTEASLVKKLEEEGIGRPSTYASIMGTIQDRGYVRLQGQALVPTFTAFAVTQFLEHHFGPLVRTGFTRGMEAKLDEIAEGKRDWRDYIEYFFTGPNGLDTLVRKGAIEIDPAQSRAITLSGLDGAEVKVGRFGPYVEVVRDGAPVRATLPESVPPADLTPDEVERILQRKIDGPDVLGAHPETGEPIYVLTGQYGPYVQLGEVGDDVKPKRASLPKGLTPETVTLDQAVQLLSLPRRLGEHPGGGTVLVGLGRFGPYVVRDQGKAGKDYRSLKAEDDLFTLALTRALELLAQPKGVRGRSAPAPLREVGKHPKDGAAINLYDGKYGLYVKHGEVNATVPKGTAPEAVTVEQAVALLAERAAAGKKPRGRRTRR